MEKYFAIARRGHLRKWMTWPSKSVLARNQVLDREYFGIYICLSILKIELIGTICVFPDNGVQAIR